MAGSGGWPALLGRRRECEALSGLVAAAKAGRSQVLVVRGEAGMGKTALLDVVVRRAAGCRVARAAGVESETELAFAGVHQLCGPHLDRLAALPGPQREALGAAFGLRPRGAPDRFLVGLAVLGLLTGVAEDRPLICVVDDAQWLDRESRRTLEFVARRLVADPVAMVFAARGSDAGPVLAGLPELVLRGLGGGDAAALLDSAVTGPLDPRVRDRILAESSGNPLALLELPRELPAAELAYGGGTGTPYRPDQELLRQVGALPEPSRRLLLAAAAEPLGDIPLLLRAAEQLGLDPDASAAAEAAGLIELRGRVRFRHPLVRSAVYRSATPAERREVHRALADATDGGADPDRGAWHRAHAAVGPDEAVAAELERSAGRALAHGGLAAAAAFLEQAVVLTPDEVPRLRRSLAAARAKLRAGAYDDAATLLAGAGAGPVQEADRARIDLLRAEICFAAGSGNEALPLLLAAAGRLEPLDPRLARDAYLDAMSAALVAGRLAAGPGPREVAEAARRAPRPDPPRKGDLLLDSLAVLFTEGYAPAAPPARRALAAFGTEDLDVDEVLRCSRLAAATAASLWDDAGWDLLTRRHLDAARAAGALGALPLALHSRVVVQLFTGDLTAAAALVEEARSLAEATRGTPVPYGEIGLLALRGHEEQAGPALGGCLDDAVARGDGGGVTMARWARAVLSNGLGRYDEALDAARDAAADPLEPGAAKWALAELVEAAVHTGRTRVAAAALERLSALTRVSGTDWARGVEAGRRALLHDGAAADRLHREAVTRLARTRMRVELARAQLGYGEWLRREGRRADARTQLRSAYESLTGMGVDAFAERARHELLAAGEAVHTPAVGTAGPLTAQEGHIARLAAEGLTNPEIGAALFLSPRTVEWHLRKVFAKLGLTTRRQLRLSLPAAYRATST